jgi:predicted nucleic acid-binding protein
MAESPGLVYFDTCPFIDLLQQSDQDRFEACDDLRLKAENKLILIVTSAVTIVEVNKLPKSTTVLPEEQSKKILDFFENPYIAIRPLDRRTAELAHELTRTHRLDNLVAIHVATAIVNKVPVFYTYDDGGRKKRSGLLRHHLKTGDPPLQILKPPDPNAGTLFEKK